MIIMNDAIDIVGIKFNIDLCEMVVSCFLNSSDTVCTFTAKYICMHLTFTHILYSHRNGTAVTLGTLAISLSKVYTCMYTVYT